MLKLYQSKPAQERFDLGKKIKMTSLDSQVLWMSGFLYLSLAIKVKQMPVNSKVVLSDLAFID